MFAAMPAPDFIADFENACAAAEVAPTAALRKGGVHDTLWKRWKEGTASPTVRNLERAWEGLDALKSEKVDSAEAANEAEAPRQCA